MLPHGDPTSPSWSEEGQIPCPLTHPCAFPHVPVLVSILLVSTTISFTSLLCYVIARICLAEARYVCSYQILSVHVLVHEPSTRTPLVYWPAVYESRAATRAQIFSKKEL